MVNEKRKCRVCGEEKELATEFRRQYRKRWYYLHECKKCYAKKLKNEGEGKRQLEWFRKRKRGISGEEVTRMRVQQGNRCGICKETFVAEPCLDHCHETGLIRGLLCRKCNLALGGFKDNIERLRSAVEYLEFHKLRQTLRS